MFSNKCSSAQVCRLRHNLVTHYLKDDILVPEWRPLPLWTYLLWLKFGAWWWGKDLFGSVHSICGMLSSGMLAWYPLCNLFRDKWRLTFSPRTEDYRVLTISFHRHRRHRRHHQCFSGVASLEGILLLVVVTLAMAFHWFCYIGWCLFTQVSLTPSLLLPYKLSK